MNHFKFLLIGIVVALTITSCEFVNRPPESRVQSSPAGHVVINEVFSLPPPNQNSYSWLELYNPTLRPVDMSAWSLSFFTRRTRIILDSFGRAIAYSVQDSTFDLAFKLGGGGGRAFEIPAGGFVTIVSDENRLLNYTDYGPGNGPQIDLHGQPITLPADTLSPDSILYLQYTFSLRSSDQLVLKDSLGNAVDVVRYGNYIYPGPGPDPFPNNHSAGYAPAYQSLSRYADAFSTGNTENDFYQTGVGDHQLSRPTPHFISAEYKQR